MKKEEKIKEAWGNINDKINENGWFYFGYACNGWEDVKCWLEDNNLISDESYYDMTYDQCDNGDLICVQIRPKSLQGIENNNGWVKVESEEDLPKEEGFYFTMRRDKTKVEMTHFFFELSKEFKKICTHYQPIEKPKTPIY